ncbi:MAG: OadG family protein [Clostridiales bacterium]|jgi:sodium pump decarboxylase gamma subunit|nr:OadG family protein [Clostridiales bacterium]
MMYIANYRSLLDAATTMSVSERLLYGLQVFVIGICTVFIVLAILWGVMALFKLFFYTIPNNKKNVQKGDANVKKVENIPSLEEIPLAAPPANDTQLIAVITAAIAAYNDSCGNTLPFRVVSYRRTAGAGGWNGAANDTTL